MSDECECCEAVADRWTPSKYFLLKQKVKRWIFLNIWCKHMYRHVMRIMHKFNLHYAPPNPLNPEFGEINHWCQWCGLRGSTYKYDPNKGPTLFD